MLNLTILPIAYQAFTHIFSDFSLQSLNFQSDITTYSKLCNARRGHTNYI